MFKQVLETVAVRLCLVLGLVILSQALARPGHANIEAVCQKEIEMFLVSHWGLPEDYQGISFVEALKPCMPLNDKPEGDEDDVFLLFLGLFYDSEQEYDSAKTLFAASTAKGNALAMICLGDTFIYREAPGDNEKAALLYRRAMELGSRLGMSKLAHMYHQGWGVAQSDVKAFGLYYMAAQLEEPAGLFNLGRFYDKGWVVKADGEQALYWYEKAAALGEEAAFYNIAVLYDDGRLLPENNRKAVEYYRTAAEKGFPLAMLNLGMMYRHGEGIKKDERAAIRWYEKAAAAGLIEAESNLGVLYYRGSQIRQDHRKALDHVLKAAVTGDAKAMANAATIYSDEDSEVRDPKAAYFWAFRASVAGYFEHFALTIVELQRELPPKVRGEIEDLAQSWEPGTPPKLN